ncbi:MAG: hypothetical protein WCF30_07670 [Terracidiphilus sp.]
MAMNATSADGTGAGARHVGILVIHGIGNENPYGTLDSFARGLYEHFGKYGPAGYEMAAEWKERSSDPSHKQQSWTQAQIRFTPAAGSQADAIGAPRITMAEYYWSPATKGRLKDLDVLTWLIRTGLEPFRYLSENIQVMEAASQRTGASKPSAFSKAGRGTFIVVREFFRFAFLYLPLLASMIALGAFLGSLKDLPSLLSGLKNLTRWQMAIGLIAALRLMVLGSLIGYFMGFYKWLRFRVTNSSARRYNFIALSGALGFAILFIMGPAWFLHVKYLHVTNFLLLDPVYSQLFLPLLWLSIAVLARAFLVDFLGDVAIYTNLNQRSANFAIRAQILEECGHALTSLYLDLRAELLNSGDDFRIVVAAHSLGTVIAYDTLNDLFNRARINAAPVGAGAAPSAAPVSSLDICRRLGGLLTFGSPLNKTYYFFRDQSAAEELVRAQIIDGLHSFRLTAPDELLDGAPVSPVQASSELARLTSDLNWINIWSWADPVSGKLFFYRVPPPNQIHRPYFVLFPWSHLRYWTDKKMYRIFALALLGIPVTRQISGGPAQTNEACT